MTPAVGMSLRKRNLNLPIGGKKVSNRETIPYCRAAKFPGERVSGAVYFGIQKLIDRPDVDLSAYRLQIRSVWHVAVVGEYPASELAEELDKTFAAGEPVDLPSEVLAFMSRRRMEQIQHGSWVEGHYRPGLGFRFGRK